MRFASATPSFHLPASVQGAYAIRADADERAGDGAAVDRAEERDPRLALAIRIPVGGHRPAEHAAIGADETDREQLARSLGLKRSTRIRVRHRLVRPCRVL